MFKKLIIGAGGGLIFVVLNLLANALLARTIGPDILGQYQVVLSAITLITTIFAFGIGDATVYSLNHLKLQRSQIHASVHFLSITVGILTFFLSLCAFAFFPNYFGVLSPIELILVSLSAVSVLWSAYLRPLLMADLKIERTTLAANFGRLALFCVAGIIFIFGLDALSASLFAYFVANLLTALILLYSLEEFQFYPYSQTIKALMTSGVKFGALSILVVSYSNLSILALNALHTNSFGDIGIYSRAVTISNLLTLIPSALGGLLFARWSSSDLDKILSQLQITIRVSLVLSLISALAIFLLGEIIIVILYGPLFSDAMIYLPLLSISALIGNIALIQRSFIVGQGEIKQWAIALAFATFVLFAGIVALYPFFGLMSAPIALTASNTTLVITSFLFLRRYQLPLKKFLLLEKRDVVYIYNQVASSYYKHKR